LRTSFLTPALAGELRGRQERCARCQTIAYLLNHPTPVESEKTS
jgi:hypothetical protein